MAKKIAKPSVIAFVYYLTANILLFVPSFVVTILVFMYIPSFTLAATITYLILGFIYYYALRYSGKNICKIYIIENVEQIRGWTLGYLVGFNLLFILLGMRQGALNSAPTMSIYGLIVYGLIVYLYTSRFVMRSAPEEIQEAEVPKVTK